MVAKGRYQGRKGDGVPELSGIQKRYSEYQYM